MAISREDTIRALEAIEEKKTPVLHALAFYEYREYSLRDINKRYQRMAIHIHPDKGQGEEDIANRHRLFSKLQRVLDIARNEFERRDCLTFQTKFATEFSVEETLKLNEENAAEAAQVLAEFEREQARLKDAEEKQQQERARQQQEEARRTFKQTARKRRERRRKAAEQQQRQREAEDKARRDTAAKRHRQAADLEDYDEMEARCKRRRQNNDDPIIISDSEAPESTNPQPPPSQPPSSPPQQAPTNQPPPPPSPPPSNQPPPPPSPQPAPTNQPPPPPSPQPPPPPSTPPSPMEHQHRPAPSSSSPHRPAPSSPPSPMDHQNRPAPTNPPPSHQPPPPPTAAPSPMEHQHRPQHSNQQPRPPPSTTTPPSPPLQHRSTPPPPSPPAQMHHPPSPSPPPHPSTPPTTQAAQPPPSPNPPTAQPPSPTAQPEERQAPPSPPGQTGSTDRPPSEERRATYLSDPSVRPIQKDLVLHNTRLNGHVWNTATMAFDAYVNSSASRPDMKRSYDCLQRYGRTNVQRQWMSFSSAHTWYVIPDTISCGRTFARSPQEVYYLSAMCAFVDEASNGMSFDIFDIPLLQCRDSLLYRWWHRFRTTLQILHRNSVWANCYVGIPSDTEDMDTPINPFEAREFFGQPPSFWSLNRFPCGVPCPVPLCMYYFYDRIQQATGVEGQFWSKLMELEHSLLFVSNWWSESSKGQRAFVLNQETIQWLSERIPPTTVLDWSGDQPIVFDHIRNCMDQASATPKGLHNNLRFPSFQLPPCSFVQSLKDTGEVDTNITGGRFFERCVRDGKIKQCRRLHFI